MRKLRALAVAITAAVLTSTALAAGSPPGLDAAKAACAQQGLTAGTADFKACVRQQLKGSGSSGPSAATIASKACAAFAKQHADAFQKAFGSESACESALLPVVQAALAACTSNAQGSSSDSQKSCVQGKIQAAIHAQGTKGHGAGTAGHGGKGKGKGKTGTTTTTGP